MVKTIQTENIRSQYIGKNFLLTVESAKKGGILTEIIDEIVQVGNDIKIDDYAVKSCIERFNLSDPIVCVKWPNQYL